MSERIITFTLNGLNISTDYEEPDAINESSGYLKATFLTDETWSKCERLEAIFYNERVLAEPVVLDESMTCDIPEVVLEKPVSEVYCGLVGYGDGGYRIASDSVAISVGQAAYTKGKTPAQPSPDLYAKIMEKISGKVDVSWGEGNSGKYLVIGEDGKVTLGEGGGGGSGESGADGKDGVTFIPSVSSDGVISWTNDGDKQNPTPVNIKGPQGPQGPQGDDYTLTEADKQEIAEMAAELVPSGGGGDSADEYVVVFDKTFEANVANTESWGGEHTLYDYRHFYCTDVNGNDLKVDAFHVFIHVPAQSADIVQSGEVKVYVGRGKPGWWGSYTSDQPQPYIGHPSFVPSSGKEAWCWYDYDLRTQTLTGQRVDGKAFNNNFNSNGILGIPSFPRAIVRNNWQYWNGIELDLVSGHFPAGTRVLIYARKLNEAKVAERPR